MAFAVVLVQGLAVASPVSVSDGELVRLVAEDVAKAIRSRRGRGIRTAASSARSGSRLPTVWSSEGCNAPGYDWINCMLATFEALDELAKEEIVK